jgi:hypothetical protein
VPTTCGTPGGVCRVFVTNATFSGDLGGLAGADAKCQAAASAANLSGTYRAWLSTTASSPAADATFTKASGPYRRVDGVQVVADWADLTDGTLGAAIRVTETGTQLFNNSVWTHTLPDGTAGGVAHGGDCAGWTEGSGSLLAGTWGLSDPPTGGGRRTSPSGALPPSAASTASSRAEDRRGQVPQTRGCANPATPHAATGAWRPEKPRPSMDAAGGTVVVCAGIWRLPDTVRVAKNLTLGGASVADNRADFSGGIYNNLGTVTLDSGAIICSNTPLATQCSGSSITGTCPNPSNGICPS